MTVPARSELHWERYVDSVTMHTAVVELGTIEIRDAGESVTCGHSGRTWPLLSWKAQGDGFSVSGTARSLGRAKEDALAALQLLSALDFETSTPADDERVPTDALRKG